MVETGMRYAKLLMCVIPVLAMAGCDDDGTSVQTPPDAALVRFINTVPDTGTVDLRFIDKVENLPTLLGVAFRSSSGLYQRVIPGTRPTRVFPTAEDPVLTQIMLVDTTINLSVNNRYTLVYAGRASGNQDRLAVLEDAAVLPTPGAGSIAIKVVHAAVGTGAVDIYISPATSAANNTDPIANSVGVARNVAYLGQSAYVTVPNRPTTGETLYQFTVTAAGSTTPLFTARPNVPGIAATAGQSYGAQPGVQIAGSVLTAVITAGSIPGTRQSTAATQTPSVALVIDKTLDP